MTKYGWDKQLRAALSALPKEEQDKALDFYTESFEDKLESGLSEEAAIESFGPVSEAAQRILSAYYEDAPMSAAPVPSEPPAPSAPRPAPAPQARPAQKDAGAQAVSGLVSILGWTVIVLAYIASISVIVSGSASLISSIVLLCMASARAEVHAILFVFGVSFIVIAVGSLMTWGSSQLKVLLAWIKTRIAPEG